MCMEKKKSLYTYEKEKYSLNYYFTGAPNILISHLSKLSDCINEIPAV